jgi:hypothetical protein
VRSVFDIEMCVSQCEPSRAVFDVADRGDGRDGAECLPRIPAGVDQRLEELHERTALNLAAALPAAETRWFKVK